MTPFDDILADLNRRHELDSMNRLRRFFDIPIKLTAIALVTAVPFGAAVLIGYLLR